MMSFTRVVVFAAGVAGLSLLGVAVSACSSSASNTGATSAALDPDTAPVAQVDRFQDSFAHLFKRSGPAFDPSNVSKVVPAANAPIDMDNFLVHALGPAGEKIVYYSLDILPDVPARAYEFVGADDKPILNQLPIIDLLPGDAGYNDFVLVTKVKVGAGYVANSLTSFDDVDAAVAAKKVTLVPATTIANWAVVPKGTTAMRKFAGKTITGFRAWEKHTVAHTLVFENDLVPDGGKVPTSDIVVIFKNGMSPAEGFAQEPGSNQTHNAIATLPGQPGYSSYWDHGTGKVSGFDSVMSFATAVANKEMDIPVIVNCPVVE